MFSGTTVGKNSGNWIGAHQRIDRLARVELVKHLKNPDKFPSIKDILHFEGDNGPDGIKRKSPSIDEPWHYLDPEKMHDLSLIDMIEDHIENLSRALKRDDTHRAAFEAAWLAHAVVDGLTPAHHFPLADKIEELFGMPHTERLSVKEKTIIKGTSRRDTIKKNWEYWGNGGIFSSHALFEHGIAMGMVGKRYKVPLSDSDRSRIAKEGYRHVFLDYLRRIVQLNVYEKFQQQGWSWRVSQLTQKQLIPYIIQAVALAWYAGTVKRR